MPRSNNPTIADIYREQGEMHTKLDRLIEDLDKGDRARGKLEARVRKLERWKSWVLGIATAVGAGIGYVSSSGGK